MYSWVMCVCVCVCVCVCGVCVRERERERRVLGAERKRDGGERGPDQTSTTGLAQQRAHPAVKIFRKPRNILRM